ncbi:hypothetical protein PFISCL1PPCAC_14790, partial [Pristionchus fissidentatus]
DTSIENLKFLSSRQAIEDIVEFIRQKNEEKGGDQMWIVVGGSYAGSLAAWIRLIHPELVAGSLASSAPILAQMDFYGYLQTVDEEFKKYGGPCYDQISNGFEDARKLMQSPLGRDQLSEIFEISPPLSSNDDLSDNDIDTFYMNLMVTMPGRTVLDLRNKNESFEDIAAHPAGYDPLQALADVATPYIPVSLKFENSID